MNFDRRMQAHLDLTEHALRAYLPKERLAQQRIVEAMEYSLLAGGKRVRPVLMLEFCRVSGGEERLVLPLAAALEMIHTYSLIHDDLPCMDNDDLRRGRPTSHRVFGEAMATLAGDALLNYAAETALGADGPDYLDPALRLRAVCELFGAAGVYGMIGGQVLDMERENRALSLDQVLETHRLKTGALICAAARIGVICAGASDELLEAATEYAQKIGLVFQIVDDVLDCSGSAQQLGKQTGSDARSGKTTFVTLLGEQGAMERARELTDEAKQALAPFDDASFLCEFADRLLVRQR